MSYRQTSVALAIILMGLAGRLQSAEFYASPQGIPNGRGTLDSPWDLQSALDGRQKLAPGDTLWIAGGTYKHPDRRLGSPGYVVRLAGSEGKPIQVRGAAGQRVTIDGGLTVQPPSTWLWVRDLEILVSENFSMPRRVEEPGSHPQSYNRPWGGLNVHAGEHCKYINLVIHDNAQGVSFWSGATDSELCGAILYDNGWDAPDRGHGHAIYTQNQNGTKTIADCIMTGGHSYTMHAYGSSRAYVDHYLVEGNICYDAGTFLIGGGRPSRDIRVLDNALYHVGMQIGYSAPENEDCEIRGNTIVGGGLTVKDFKEAVVEDNLVIPKDAPRPDEPARIILRPNRYDPARTHLAIFNWQQKPKVAVQLDGFLKPGDRFRLLDPRNCYGKPVLAAAYDGKPVELPVQGEFAAFVVVKEMGGQNGNL